MTTVITVTEHIDDDPDLSWLDQTDDQMGEGFEASASERKASFGSDWWMVGLVARGSATCSCGEAMKQDSAGLWGIESDGDPSYFDEIAKELAGEVARQLSVTEYEIEWRAQ